MEDTYTVAQIAEKLQVHVITVQRWLRAGAVQGIRLGREWRVTESALQRFLDERTRGDSDKEAH